MVHYYFEDLDLTWVLLRETPSSQIFLTENKEKQKIKVDIHYTSPKVCFVTVIVEGDKLTDGFSHWLFDDISKIINRKDYYAVIDYSLAYTKEIIDGNYGVDDDIKKIYKDTL